MLSATCKLSTPLVSPLQQSQLHSEPAIPAERPMNQLGRLARTVDRAARTHYPKFIFGLPLASGEIPIFNYHDVTADQLGADLEFLAHNHYRTLSLEEFIRARNTRQRNARCVLLTFDDARKSFSQTALPLLQTFGARATLFAPTHWMSRPSHNAADDLFMTWEKLRLCLASGLVDVQAHAHRHALVFISEQLVDFATPDSLARFDVYDWPMRGVGELEELGRPALGTPIYRAAPLLSAANRYIENGTVTMACRDFVREQGPDLFACSNWQRQLRDVHTSQSRRHPGRQASVPELLALIQSEFERCRDEFRRHLGYQPLYFAYPWMLGTKLSLEFAKAVGIRAAFGVALNYRDERRSHTFPLPVFGRLRCDWLRFLPGRRRSSLFGALRHKVTGLATRQNLAH